MASAPQSNLPLFYNDLMPLNSRDHGKFKSRMLENVKFLETTHAVPVTSDEFVDAQRFFPIVFTNSEESVPIALFALNEGINTFIDDKGQFEPNIYLPAYIRRYPYLLARLQQDSDDMSLCFDPSSEAVGDFAEGEALFGEDGQPTDHTKSILEFCERFEQAGARTKAFMDELKSSGLLMDGEISISQNDDPDKPFIYRGFKMVDEQKLRELPAEKLEDYNKSGFLILIHAHLFSLNLMRILFGKQIQQGKGPQAQAA